MFGLAHTTARRSAPRESALRESVGASAPADDDTLFSAAFFIEGCGIKLSDHPIIMAVSGGPDSMAMAAHIAAWHRDQGSHPLKAVIIDHGIRNESADEAILVQSWLEKLGITAEVLTVNEPAPKKGVQAWARGQRYRLLAEAARNMPTPALVVTGHHALDQAETIAMRLSAGSGMVGIKGMQAITRYEDMMIIRPFLDVPPTTLRQILTDQHIPYVDDPSNQMEKFERIAVRQQMDRWAEDGITPHHLRKLGKLSARMTATLNQHLIAKMAGLMGRTKAGAIWVDEQAFHALPDQAAVYLIRDIVSKGGQSNWPVSTRAASVLIKNLHERFHHHHDDGIAATLGGLEWHRRDGVVWIYPEAEQYHEAEDCDAGRRVYHHIWQVTAPCDGVITPLGKENAAILRKALPEYVRSLRTAIRHQASANASMMAPMRSLWQLPVFKPASKKQAKRADLLTLDGLIALEDGGIIPHVIECESSFLQMSNDFTIRDLRHVKSGQFI